MRGKNKSGVYFIAEIGGNHEGDFGLAKELLDQALESGVDAVKFQAYSGEGIANRIVDPGRVKHFNKFTLSMDNHIELAELCLANGVDYLASVWNEEMLSQLISYMRYVKIGSGDLTNYKFFKILASHEKPLILSTGLSDFEEVEAAVKTIDLFYRNCSLGDIEHHILQCTSMYPIAYSDAHLNVMKTYKKAFPKYKVGYSDHTVGTTAIQVAISMGAKMIEAHFTDRSIKSEFRDHLVSKTAEEFKELINFTEQVLELQGSNKKELLDIEKSNGHEKSFRRALYLKTDMARGAIVKEGDIAILRPVAGIAASEYYELLGKKLVRDITALEPLAWSDFTDDEFN